MKKDDKGGGRAKPPGISDEDASLWRRFTHDIDPLHPPRAGDESDAAAESVPPRKKEKKPAPESALFIPPASFGGPPVTGDDSWQIDRRTEDRLRRGKIDIDARIDLHGHTQDGARDALTRFIDGAVRRGLRCVLVITGKGRSSHDEGDWKFNDGVLRQRVPEWLASPPHAEHVLKCMAAQPRDRGESAYYVYLRRRR